jgi:hypothetical protein
VIELVDRLETEDQRGITVLFQDHGSRQRCLQAVCRVMAQHAPEAAQLRALWRRFGVVGQCVQELLDRRRGPERGDDAAFGSSEGGQRRRAGGGAAPL